MRKIVTAVATALTLTTLGLSTALADSNPPGYRGGDNHQPGWNQPQGHGQPGWNQPQGHGQPGQGHGPNGWDNHGGPRYDQGDDYRGHDGYRGPDGRRHRPFNFDRHNGGFDTWERGWGRSGYEGQRGQGLPQWRLIRILERQGFYGVRGLRPARFGWGMRAYAYTYRGRPVMLRVNPHNGRVLDVRYI